MPDAVWGYEDGHGAFRPKTAEEQAVLIAHVSAVEVDGRKFKAWTKEECRPSTAKVIVYTYDDVEVYKALGLDTCGSELIKYKKNGLSDLPEGSVSVFKSGVEIGAEKAEYVYIILDVNKEAWDILAAKPTVKVTFARWRMWHNDRPLYKYNGFPPLKPINPDRSRRNDAKKVNAMDTFEEPSDPTAAAKPAAPEEVTMADPVPPTPVVVSEEMAKKATVVADLVLPPEVETPMDKDLELLVDDEGKPIMPRNFTQEEQDDLMRASPSCMTQIKFS